MPKVTKCPSMKKYPNLKCPNDILPKCDKMLKSHYAQDNKMPKMSLCPNDILPKCNKMPKAIKWPKVITYIMPNATKFFVPQNIYWAKCLYGQIVILGIMSLGKMLPWAICPWAF